MAAIVLVVALAFVSLTDATNYKEGEKVLMYVNKVGPYFNPHETYHYYQLPVCRPKKIEHKSLTLGEVLDGDRMALSMYDLAFKKNSDKKELCKVAYTEDELQLLRDAIEDMYYFEFVIDDIPVRGFIGHLEEGGYLPHTHKIYLWAHLNFNIEYNGDQIIYANVTTKEQAPVGLDSSLTAPFEVAFTYSIKWHKTEMKYEERGKRVRDNSFFPKTLEIHWLSIINSMVLVFLLIGFVVIILTRVLKSDFARYNVDEEESDDLDNDDNGWKIIHSDVFRFPALKSLFCAILGVGTQFLALATGIMMMAMMGMFNVHRHGAINSAGVILFAFTSCIAGYVAANMYRKLGEITGCGTSISPHVYLQIQVIGLDVKRLLTPSPIRSCHVMSHPIPNMAPFFFVWAVVNSVAWGYGTTQALPWTTVVLLMCLWLFVGYPLTVLGGIFGKNWANGFDAPCRTKNISREIPPVPWYRSAFAHCVVGGFLPFSAISVELYYIFATLWGREQYTLYGILFIVYGILLSVTACISVALTYFQLSAEDYRWWWRSIFSAGSTGIFVFLYAMFYYFKRSNMSGALQTLEFFGYTALSCYVFFLMLGTVSFFASLNFVRYIYVNLKMD